MQPLFECRSLGGLSWAYEFDTPAYFAKHKRAQEQILIRD